MAQHDQAELILDANRLRETVRLIGGNSPKITAMMSRCADRMEAAYREIDRLEAANGFLADAADQAAIAIEVVMREWGGRIHESTATALLSKIRSALAQTVEGA